MIRKLAAITRLTLFALPIVFFCESALSDTQTSNALYDNLETMHRHFRGESIRNLIWIVVSIIVAFVCANLAGKEGRSKIGWWLIGLIFNINGLIFLYAILILQQIRQNRS
jgi:hypothetical protein